MSYGHAPYLADGKPDPVAELDTAIRRLGAWAALNPGLRELHLDFEACLARIREVGLNEPTRVRRSNQPDIEGTKRTDDADINSEEEKVNGI